MTVQGFTDQGETKADNLLAGEFPRVSMLVPITGGKYERGTVLGINNSGKYTISTSAPEAILAETVDASDEDKEAVKHLGGKSDAVIKRTNLMVKKKKSDYCLNRVFRKTKLRKC